MPFVKLKLLKAVCKNVKTFKQPAKTAKKK